MINDNTSIRLLLPEVVWLEAEAFDWAKDFSNDVTDESQQWQAYLDALALIGCEKWLQEHMPKQPVKKDFIGNTAYLKIGEFKFCIIATEHLLDEVANIPKDLVERSDLLAHFYLIIEVIEEQEEMIIRGFLRYDQLVASLNSINSRVLQETVYQLPLSKFDPEPNHLLFYCLYSEPAAILLPVITTEVTEQKSSVDIFATRTKLSQWLQNLFDESWQTIDTFINPKSKLTLSLRNTEKMIKRGKLIDLGIQLDSQRLALLVNISKELEDKIRVLIQLHPTGSQIFLPPNVKLSLLSEESIVICEVFSRKQDNYIQLNPFKGKEGKRFSIEVSLEDLRIRENFEL